MKLLLLLSALLSALTGVNGGARSAPVPVAINRMAMAAEPARVAVAMVAGRPLAAAPPRSAVRDGATLPAWRLAATTPLYLSRRRE